MKHTHITVFGDDPRLEYVNRELCALGYSSEYFPGAGPDQAGKPVSSDCLVFPLFPPIKLLTRALDYGNGNALFCAGLPSKEFILMANEHGFSVYDYMSDPHVTMLNGVATAEGAIAEAIRLSPLTLQDAGGLVIGFGRCGELLSLKCRSLGCNLTVYDWNPHVLSHAQAHGFPVIEDLTDLGPYAVIFNTAPYLNLTAEVLQTAAEDAAIIDLASSPGGTDFAYCKQQGIKAKLCPSLPAIFAPKTSGIILAHAIHNRLVKLQISS